MAELGMIAIAFYAVAKGLLVLFSIGIVAAVLYNAGRK